MSIKKLTARPYQEKLDKEVRLAWANGHRVVLAVLPTGGGKTFLFTGIIADEPAPGYVCAIAHRRELIGQMSLALNKRAVRHFVVAPNNVIRWIVSQHILEHGQSFYDPQAPCAVSSVDTLLSRQKQGKIGNWFNRVTLWVMDEGHHLTRDNKWGKAAALFPNARGLSVTATPERPDGKGLSRASDGVVDIMVSGPSGRDLINQGYLTDYKIYGPDSHIDLSDVTISAATGDYSQPQMINKVKQSQITGDIVKHYLRLAPGKLGITFVPSVDIAVEVAAAYNAAGVPADVVSAKTPDPVRAEAVRRLRAGEIKNLVNVDIFGEGFDLPAIEVVSLARPTESYVLLCQQFGRALRPMPGKSHAIIIDHVGNILRLGKRFGLPDSPKEWSLEGREKRGNKNANLIPIRICPNCTGVYESYDRVCPYCSYRIIPTVRSAPEFVDGDLYEIDPEVLEQMRQAVAQVDRSPAAVRDGLLKSGASIAAAMGAAKQQRLRQEAQTRLRKVMEWWGGYQQFMGLDQRASWQLFYLKYGVDVMSAQALGRPDAEELAAKLERELGLDLTP